jgi:hypothetical protein
LFSAEVKVKEVQIPNPELEISKGEERGKWEEMVISSLPTPISIPFPLTFQKKLIKKIGVIS